MNQNETCKYIISLIRSLFEDSLPESKASDISFRDVYDAAKKHHVRNMCFYAIEKLEEKPDPGLYKAWENYTMGAGVQSAMQLEERDIVIRKFQEKGIDCLPLKGCFLKEMYPDPKYREMADLDLLIRKESQDAVRDIMDEFGYHTKLFREHAVHDVYVKPPFIEFEMHIALTSEENIEIFHMNTDQLRMLRDPWMYAVPTDRPHVYTLKPEDSYIYLVLHLAQHYFKSGIGIRQFIDLWVYNHQYHLDKEYIYQALEGTEFKQFCIDAEKLADSWMSGTELPEELEEMQDYVFSSGVYGIAEHKVIHRMERMEKAAGNGGSVFRYLSERMFPSIHIMKNLYPYLDERPFLLPYAWASRLISRTFKGKSPATEELKAYIKMKISSLQTKKQKDNSE